MTIAIRNQKVPFRVTFWDRLIGNNSAICLYKSCGTGIEHMYLQAVLQDKRTINLRIATLIRTHLKTFIMVYSLYRTDTYKKDSVYLCMY
jgi:hypothetical protein